MAEKFRSYETARKLFSFLEFTCWCVVGLGALIVLLGFSQAPSNSRQFGIQPSFLMAYGTSVLGLFVAFNGVIGAATVQFFRAGVDTAEYAQQQLSVARKQLEISRQGLGQSPVKSAGFEFAPSTTQASEPKSDQGYAPPVESEQPKITKDGAQDTHQVKSLNLAQTQLSYRDVEFIMKLNGSYLLEGRIYPTLDDVKLRIDHKFK
jgi:hypothetical protein